MGKNYKFWFATGSQDLYGEKCLKVVAKHSEMIVKGLNDSGLLPYEVVLKPTLIDNGSIRKTFNEANQDEACAGVITWMHTFSPAKSWILGLQEYRKPLLHLHTQFNEEIPYDSIDMDFMEDYTYNFVPGKEGILQAHMLEVCPTIADCRPVIKVSPLSMGNREDPARLVFTSKPGKGVATSLVDLGNRFRLLINEVECLPQDISMPKLPVASAFWRPEPSLEVGAEAWILAGGAHHTAFSYDISAEQMGDWAEAMGIEAVYIDKNTNIRDFKNQLKWNSVYYR